MTSVVKSVHSNNRFYCRVIQCYHEPPWILGNVLIIRMFVPQGALGLNSMVDFQFAQWDSFLLLEIC